MTKSENKNNQTNKQTNKQKTTKRHKILKYIQWSAKHYTVS